MSQEEFWNKNAENWAQVIQANMIASRRVTNPALVTQILKYKGQSLIDIGCGEAWLSEPMLDASIDYFGIDGSKKLIDIAVQRKVSVEHVTYEQMIAGWNPERLFDLAVFNFSLLDENIESLLLATKKLISPNGKIIIQTLNPNHLPNQQDGWNVEDFKTMGIKFEGTMPWYGRTKESWLAQFKACDLRIVDTAEPLIEAQPVSIIFILERT